MEAQLCTGRNKRGGKFKSAQSTSGRSSDKMKVCDTLRGVFFWSAQNPKGFEADRKENAPVGHFQGGAFMEAQLCTGRNKRGGKFRSVQSTSGRSSDKMKV